MIDLVSGSLFDLKCNSNFGRLCYFRNNGEAAIRFGRSGLSVDQLAPS